MENLFILFSCDEGMNNNSMKVIGIFEDKELRKYLKENALITGGDNGIQEDIDNEKGRLEYNQSIDTLDNWSLKDINLCLYCGFISELQVNKPFSTLFNGGY